MKHIKTPTLMVTSKLLMEFKYGSFQQPACICLQVSDIIRDCLLQVPNRNIAGSNAHNFAGNLHLILGEEGGGGGGDKDFY